MSEAVSWLFRYLVLLVATSFLWPPGSTFLSMPSLLPMPYLPLHALPPSHALPYFPCPPLLPMPYLPPHALPVDPEYTIAWLAN